MKSRPGMWRRIVAAIDRLNDTVGRLVYWLVLLMVLIGALNALARYAGRMAGTNLTSNAFIELQWYLFSLVFLLGAAYTLKHDAHVRVDVLYGRLSERGRAWIDLLGYLLLLIPFSVFAIRVAWPDVRDSWAILETSPDPGGLPRYPIKAIVPLAFMLLVLQGVAEAARRFEQLRAAAPPDGGEAGPVGAGPGPARGEGAEDGEVRRTRGMM